jgi:hypothetical protein
MVGSPVVGPTEFIETDQHHFIGATMCAGTSVPPESVVTREPPLRCGVTAELAAATPMHAERWQEEHPARAGPPD